MVSQRPPRRRQPRQPRPEAPRVPQVLPARAPLSLHRPRPIRRPRQRHRLHWHRVPNIELLEYALQVPHERRAPRPAPALVLPVRAVLDGDGEVDRVLVLHLVDVDVRAVPLARVRGHVGADALLEDLDGLHGRGVGDHERRRFPEGVGAADVVDGFGGGEEFVRCDDFLAVDSAEDGREEAEFADDEGLRKR